MPAPYPKTVHAAGIIWLILGGVSMVVALWACGGVATYGVSGFGSPGVLFAVWATPAVAFGAGLAVLRGHTRDCLPWGAGSVAAAFLFAVTAGAESMSLVFLALIVAGVLALIGRTDYLAWQADRRPPTE